jgi:bacillithiol biosynthesis cysteine-adding enzyme BshC
MEILNLSLPATNRFASSYLEQSEEIQPFFHYRFNEKVEDVRRLAELSSRTFPREKVAGYIENFMERFPISEAVKSSIQRFRQDNSVVVIGGQQAGILTGPLYSIHKVISIIKLAEQKEKELDVPVIPVFWIAGEDHDYQEVNHLFVAAQDKVEKLIYPEKVLNKKMVSDIVLNKELCLKWVHNVIENFGETEHTNALLKFAEEQVNKSETFVDFFANIIMELFKDYGLLIVDSGDKEFRKIQSEFLSMQILDHESITFSLLEQQQEINKKGFPLAIDANERAANLFYYDKKAGERILLEFDRETEQFVGKSGSVSFSKSDLLDQMNNDPGILSNNVVTRPLMQEWLFPSLAFIAGPGEIAYWAELKLVFEHFKINMPPIVPRLNITLLDRSIETDLHDLNLNLEKVLVKGTNEEREQYLDAIKDKEVQELFAATRNSFLSQYQLIEAKTAELDKGLLPLLNKNENYILKEMDFMKKKLEDAVKSKHQVILNKFTRVDLALRPDGFLQERTWNVFPYLNQYGLGLMKSLMGLGYDFDGKHKVIKM